MGKISPRDNVPALAISQPKTYLGSFLILWISKQNRDGAFTITRRKSRSRKERVQKQYRFQFVEWFTKERKSGSRGNEKRGISLLVIYSVFQHINTRRYLHLHPITTGKCTYRNPHLEEYKVKQKMKVNSEDCFWSYLYSLICSGLMKGNELIRLT